MLYRHKTILKELTRDKISNGRKTVRMAPILAICGPNESQRCQLNFAKFSLCRKSFREDENFKRLSRKVRKSLSRVRFLTKNKIETAIYDKFTYCCQQRFPAEPEAADSLVHFHGLRKSFPTTGHETQKSKTFKNKSKT